MLEKKHFQDFIEQRVWKRSVMLLDTISKIKLSLFKAVGSYLLQEKNTAKYNVSLFSRLFIACQTREGDLENFFAHEY